jgi:hypothetical protein
MSNEEQIQNELNKHLKRSVVFTFQGTKYLVWINLTTQQIISIKVIEGVDNVFKDYNIIESYLKQEGFFEKTDTF